jgi:hypothetical protein
MSEQELEPGDIVKNQRLTPETDALGMIMRNDEESGLLVAYPGHDEIAYELPQFVKFAGKISELNKKDNHQ